MSQTQQIRSWRLLLSLLRANLAKSRQEQGFHLNRVRIDDDARVGPKMHIVWTICKESSVYVIRHGVMAPGQGKVIDVRCYPILPPLRLTKPMPKPLDGA